MSFSVQWFIWTEYRYILKCKCFPNPHPLNNCQIDDKITCEYLWCGCVCARYYNRPNMFLWHSVLTLSILPKHHTWKFDVFFRHIFISIIRWTVLANSLSGFEHENISSVAEALYSSFHVLQNNVPTFCMLIAFLSQSYNHYFMLRSNGCIICVLPGKKHKNFH